MNHRTLVLILCWFICVGAAPSRTQTYTAGEVISPSDVSENEDNIFSYLQAGVDTYKAASVDVTAIGNNAVDTAELVSDAVTNAKVANNAIDGTNIAIGSDAQGDILYFNGSDYVVLTTGTSGQFLKTQGSSANPTWDDVAPSIMGMNSDQDRSAANCPCFGAPYMDIFATTEGFAMKIPVAFTAQNFQCGVQTDPAGGASWVFTLRDDGSDTSVTCTISGGSTTCVDDSNTAVIADASEVSVSMTDASTPANSDGQYCSWEIVP